VDILLRYGSVRLHNDTVTTFNIHGAIHGGKNFRKVPIKRIAKQVSQTTNFSKEDDDAALRALNRARHDLKFRR